MDSLKMARSMGRANTNSKMVCGMWESTIRARSVVEESFTTVTTLLPMRVSLRTICLTAKELYSIRRGRRTRGSG